MEERGSLQKVAVTRIVEPAVTGLERDPFKVMQRFWPTLGGLGV